MDETLDLFNELQLQHQEVATKTKTLHDACDRVVCISFCPNLYASNSMALWLGFGGTMMIELFDYSLSLGH